MQSANTLHRVILIDTLPPISSRSTIACIWIVFSPIFLELSFTENMTTVIFCTSFDQLIMITII